MRARLAPQCFAVNTLAVLRRSRLPIFSSIFFSPIWGFSLNLSFLIYLAYAANPLFPLFYLKNAKMKIFLSPRFFHPFTLLLAPFSKTRKFQITLLLSTIYLKNTPSPTRLQRLPRFKKARCDPL